ncbi:putative F-box domain-containing protein [Rosa chinensis]|uniref:Putative F-box domain-containing protein n=1 Tax=Rosa chinensis TaxID=74649 RepID=A0A2P6QVW8_ROSCH|nr:putative F-box domain-containing protein [Rosa chinensis]
MKITELQRHRDPPDRPQKQYNEEEADLGHDTVHQRPYLLQLPNRRIVDIHCRIPIKTFIKCRRVCKSWRSLFSDPRFTKDLHARTPTCYLVMASGRYFLLDFNDTSSPNGVAALCFQFLRSSDDFVGSCNGFLCLYKKQLNRHGFFISNPITGECLPLPKPMKQDDPPPISCGPSADAITNNILAFLESTRPKSVKEIVYQSCCAFGFGFGFSHISGVYEKWTSEGDGSDCWFWELETYWGLSVMCNFDHQSGIYLNGCLHWIGLPTQGTRFIYVFDIESECFQHIHLPPFTLDNEITKCNLGVVNGCLSITVPSSYNFTVWVMKDHGVKEPWTKELDIKVDLHLGCGSSTQVLNS